MKPKLLLLTGPAAGEVANYLDDEETTERFDVRDYWDAPRRIVGDLEEYQAIDHEIRSLPGGEAWLVGLVLPNALIRQLRMGGQHTYWPWAHPHVQRETGRTDPARLAILAPNLPTDEYEDYTDEAGRRRIRKVPLLVERVRAWGGEVWHCVDLSRQHNIYAGLAEEEPVRIAMEDSWTEAVRAALGEA